MVCRTRSAGYDALVSIENLASSPFADELTGDAYSNILTGWEGEASLNGQAGNDLSPSATARTTL